MQKYFFIIFVVCLFFSTCRKDDEIQSNQINFLIADVHDSMYIYHDIYEYDKFNRLISIGNPAPVIPADTELTSFTYSGNSILEYYTFNKVKTFTRTWILNSNGYADTVFDYKNDYFGNRTFAKYNYDENGYLIEQTSYSFHNDTPNGQGKQYFQYTYGNLYQVISVGSNKKAVYYSKSKYEYTSLQNFIFNPRDIKFGKANKNLMRRFIYNDSLIADYNYHFNEKNLPDKIYCYRLGQDTQTEILLWNCKKINN